jgi:hypothetical protein
MVGEVLELDLGSMAVTRGRVEKGGEIRCLCGSHPSGPLGPGAGSSSSRSSGPALFPGVTEWFNHCARMQESHTLPTQAYNLIRLPNHGGST